MVTQKGYKCYDFSIKRVIVNFDINFYENTLYYQVFIHEENLKEDNSFSHYLDFIILKSSNPPEPTNDISPENDCITPLYPTLSSTGEHLNIARDVEK